MKKIYLFVNPFNTEIKAEIYDKADNRMVQGEQFTLNELFPSAVIALAEKYNIESAYIVGPKAFTHHIKEQLNEYCITRYGRNAIDFILV